MSLDPVIAAVVLVVLIAIVAIMVVLVVWLVPPTDRRHVVADLPALVREFLRRRP